MHTTLTKTQKQNNPSPKYKPSLHGRIIVTFKIQMHLHAGLHYKLGASRLNFLFPTKEFRIQETVSCVITDPRHIYVKLTVL